MHGAHPFAFCVQMAFVFIPLWAHWSGGTPRQGAPHCVVSGPVGALQSGEGTGGEGCWQWVDLPKSMKVAVLGAIVGDREANWLCF